MLRSFGIASFLALATMPTLAAEGTLVGRSDPEHEEVIVWKSEIAAREGMAILQADAVGETGTAFSDMTQCYAPTGQRVITADPTAPYVTVILAGAEGAGCRGVVPLENFRLKD